MLNYEVYDADVHDFYIQYSLIDIRYLVVVKTGILPRFMYKLNLKLCALCAYVLEKKKKRKKEKKKKRKKEKKKKRKKLIFFSFTHY
jgi:hypothetical protein